MIRKKSRGQHQRIDIRRSIKKGELRALNKSGEKHKPSLAKRRALVPEGRGLGVGGRRRKNVGVKARGKRDASRGKKKKKVLM